MRPCSHRFTLAATRCYNLTVGMMAPSEDRRMDALNRLTSENSILPGTWVNKGKRRRGRAEALCPGSPYASLLGLTQRLEELRRIRVVPEADGLPVAQGPHMSEGSIEGPASGLSPAFEAA